MDLPSFDTLTSALLCPERLKTAVLVLALAALWSWETFVPFSDWRRGRLPHAARNLGLALGNTLVLALSFGTLTVVVAGWTSGEGWGLLYLLDVGWLGRTALALVLLDGWTYLWHRANHAVPLLWRFHRMHHSDDRMDATTAVRFHLGEHIGSATLRLGLIPLVGFTALDFVLYDSVLLAVTLFHHANISLGRCDRWLRWLIVTPDMHKVHHSDWRPETDSNFATVLSVWDRLGRTFWLRKDPSSICFGLPTFQDAYWQTIPGMLATPFINETREGPQRVSFPRLQPGKSHRAEEASPPVLNR